MAALFSLTMPGEVRKRAASLSDSGRVHRGPLPGLSSSAPYVDVASPSTARQSDNASKSFSSAGDSNDGAARHRAIQFRAFSIGTAAVMMWLIALWTSYGSKPIDLLEHLFSDYDFPLLVLGCVLAVDLWAQLKYVGVSRVFSSAGVHIRVGLLLASLLLMLASSLAESLTAIILASWSACSSTRPRLQLAARAACSASSPAPSSSPSASGTATPAAQPTNTMTAGALTMTTMATAAVSMLDWAPRTLWT